ncbi:MAG TPA: NUDIX hydrolase [Erysipelotrichaceae bacterium]|nr:NUDIX hydrolase [Erysipelotrichaceae bacterium]OGF12718.1 MAG: hypothetical protein A3K15_00265 [Candidatus Edwardsbacteria bacterium GWE2_54_12]HAM62436.1 NUDIX hydrolase [Erysipelotrichaceae bacterium]HBZ40981.1 NUDIX hydrolase [Erysipelotrichaceae bacterium]
MEKFDARDIHGNLLGAEMIRGEKAKDGHYHVVVEVYTINRQGRILTTLRHPEKPFGHQWEITGGSVLMGEEIRSGALRELAEETGLVAEDKDLIEFYRHVSGDSLYHSYIVVLDAEEEDVVLQEGETVDFEFLSLDDFEERLESEAFVSTIRERYRLHRHLFHATYQKHIV